MKSIFHLLPRLFPRTSPPSREIVSRAKKPRILDSARSVSGWQKSPRVSLKRSLKRRRPRWWKEFSCKYRPISTWKNFLPFEIDRFRDYVCLMGSNLLEIVRVESDFFHVENSSRRARAAYTRSPFYPESSGDNSSRSIRPIT